MNIEDRIDYIHDVSQVVRGKYPEMREDMDTVIKHLYAILLETQALQVVAGTASELNNHSKELAAKLKQLRDVQNQQQ